MNQNCKKTSQEKFRIEKVLKRKGDKLKGDKMCQTERGTITVLIAGLTKKISYKNELYFPKPFGSFGGNFNFQVDLFNCATKLILKM